MKLPYAPDTRKGEGRAGMAREPVAIHEAGKVGATAGRGADFSGPRVADAAAGEAIFAGAVAGKAARVAGDPARPRAYTRVSAIGPGAAPAMPEVANLAGSVVRDDLWATAGPLSPGDPPRPPHICPAERQVRGTVR